MGLGAYFRSKLSQALLAMLVAGVAAAVPPAAAESLPKPVATPILMVDGRISVTNQAQGAALDMALLKSLPAFTLQTMTSWTDGMHSFTGVRLRDLMDRLGAEGTTLQATAIDEYAVAIPMSDARDYDVIVAYAIDGQPLPPDDKGPLWIVYPFSQVPALQRDFYFARCVWQLNRLTVQ